MKKKTIDRATLEAQMSAIERDKPIVTVKNILAFIAVAIIAAMLLIGCKPTTICEDIHNPKNYSGYR